MNRILILLGLALACFSLQATAQTTVTYQVHEHFETNPFTTLHWTANTTNGIVSWSTAQANSPTHSVYLENTGAAGTYDYNNPSLITRMSGVPQTGVVE